MEDNCRGFKDALGKLIEKGALLQYRMALDLKLVDSLTQEKLGKLQPPPFNDEYEQWYTESMQVVKQLLPDRFDDFKRLYRDDKRKDIDFVTYGVADYSIGLETRRGVRVLADGKAALPKLQQQVNILKAAHERLESVLFDMTEILQASLFDNELEAATELNNKGFVRGAGAIAGVVLERHHGKVCMRHGVTTRKKHPMINDYNELLKGANIVDVPTWRFIQHLGDLRNLCDHDKERDPKKDEVADLIAGVSKITKTLF